MNRISVFTGIALLCSTAIFGQAITENRYGTASESVEVFIAADLDPMVSTTTYGYFGGGRFANGSTTGFQTTLRLPAGASVIRFELDACDNSSTGEVTAWLLECVSPFNACTIFGDVFTGVIFSDGGSCGTFEKVLTTPKTIDNELNVYAVQAQNTGNFTSSTRFNAVRVYYKLQVSPPPPTATFADVPVGHPFFRFVEALAASGITFGCGGGNFCPDAPVTRGQMAVFLSAALGLHWVP